MKKFYTFLFVITTLAITNGCSKDFLKSYEDRIVGTWIIDDINRVGFGGDISDLPFKEGSRFDYNNNGAMEFNDITGDVYTGSWDIERSYYNDQQVHALHIAAVNFTTQQVRSELFEEMHFTGTNKFKAYISQGFHTYVFHFER